MPLLCLPGTTTKLATITDVNRFFRPGVNHIITYVSMATGILVGLLLILGVLKYMAVYGWRSKGNGVPVPEGLYLDI